MCTAILLLASCTSSKTAKANEYITEYADVEITIAGLTDEEFTITPKELSALQLTSGSASGQSEKAGTISAIGPTLETFLAQYSVKKTDFKFIRFFASDAYRITLGEKSLGDYMIILAVAEKDGPLAESTRPLRLLIPGEESAKWIYAVERIEFEYLEG